MTTLQDQFKQARPGDVGIVGDPVEHSLSPVMHSAAFKTWKMAFEDRELHAATYHKFHVRPEQLEQAMKLIKLVGLRGVNVTVPHKVSVGKFVDTWDPFAKSLGAVNTLLLENGQIKAFNTDGEGFKRVLERDMDWEADNKSILVLGSGGTGRVIINQLLMMGAKRVFVWNRTPSRLELLISSFAQKQDVVVPVLGDLEVGELEQEVDLIVNATSVGLSDKDGLPVPLQFRPKQLVFDVIYHRETEFMKRARASGAHVFGGEGMLLYQGARSFEIWTGTPAPLDLMRMALQSALKGNS